MAHSLHDHWPIQVRLARHTDRLDDPPIEPVSPYWAEHGLTLADPDGFRVVLAARSWSSDDELAPRRR
ncbi:MAG: hypothetical protein ACRDK0_06680 [Solirubrobacteraceae bacterium]